MSAFFAGWFTARLKSENERLEREADNAEQEAARWANANNMPAFERLRRIAKRKRDNP